MMFEETLKACGQVPLSMDHGLSCLLSPLCVWSCGWLRVLLVVVIVRAYVWCVCVCVCGIN